MPLTDAKVKNAKAGVKQVKISDSAGMYLLVTASGGKCWRLKFRIEGKEKTLALGTYPEISCRRQQGQRKPPDCRPGPAMLALT